MKNKEGKLWETQSQMMLRDGGLDNAMLRWFIILNRKYLILEVLAQHIYLFLKKWYYILECAHYCYVPALDNTQIIVPVYPILGNI